MAKVVTDEVAVALIENRLYNTGLINGLKGLNIPVEIEKDVKKLWFRNKSLVNQFRSEFRSGGHKVKLSD